MDNQSVIFKLNKFLNTNQILLSEESKLLYGNDLTQNYIPNPLAITFPKNIQNVIDLVRFANLEKIPLVPSGGRTGYSGVVLQKMTLGSQKKYNLNGFSKIKQTLHLVR